VKPGYDTNQGTETPSFLKRVRILPRYHKPLTAQRCRSETEKFIRSFEFSIVTISKKNHPSGNLKFNHLGFLQSLKLRNLMHRER